METRSTTRRRDRTDKNSNTNCNNHSSRKGRSSEESSLKTTISNTKNLKSSNKNRGAVVANKKIDANNIKSSSSIPAGNKKKDTRSGSTRRQTLTDKTVCVSGGGDRDYPISSIRSCISAPRSERSTSRLTRQSRGNSANTRLASSNCGLSRASASRASGGSDRTTREKNTKEVTVATTQNATLRKRKRYQGSTLDNNNLTVEGPGSGERRSKAVRFSDTNAAPPRVKDGKIQTRSAARAKGRQLSNNRATSGVGSRTRAARGKKIDMESGEQRENDKDEDSTEAKKVLSKTSMSTDEDDGDADRNGEDDTRGGDQDYFNELNGGEIRGSRLFSRNLASASTALQGLLKKLGAGLDDFVPSGYSSQFKTILSSLKEEGNDSKQLEALNSLCDILSIASEDSLTGFPTESFVPELVILLNKEHNPDLMLLAARSLTHLADVLPASCSAIVQYDAVPALCSRLLSIEYIDLAEQSLQALEKVSQEHPLACLRAGGLLAVLSYLDFFPTGVQRVAMSTAANIVRQIPDDMADTVLQSTTLLTNLLENHDTKVVEQACLCLSRITDSLSNKPERLEKLCSQGVVESVSKFISNPSSSTTVSVTTFSSLFKLLATCCMGSYNVSIKLLENDIAVTLADLLRNSALIDAGPASPGNTLRTSDHLVDVLVLVNELLPRIQEATSGEDSENGLAIQLNGLIPPSIRLRSRLPSNRPSQDSFEKTIRDRADLLGKYNQSFLALLLTLHESTVNLHLRHSCLMALMKAIYFSPSDMLLLHLKDLPISSFIAGVLKGADSGELNTALSMAIVLMDKLPEILRKHFVKEGVIHAIKSIIIDESLETKTDSAETSEPPREPQTARERLEDMMMRRADSILYTQRSSGTLKADASRRAKAFMERHKETFGKKSCDVTDGLKILREIASGFEKSDDVAFLAMKNLFKILAIEGESGVSTFEIISSGILGKLKSFLTKKGKNSQGGISKHESSMQHLKRFMAIAFRAHEGSIPIQHFVRRLQDVLTAIERFPVVLSQVQSSSSGMNAPLAALSQPFKLRLRRVPGERHLRDYGTNIVLIEPLATLSAVEEFLWGRVRRATKSDVNDDDDDDDDDMEGKEKGEQACAKKSTRDEKGKEQIDKSSASESHEVPSSDSKSQSKNGKKKEVPKKDKWSHKPSPKELSDEEEEGEEEDFDDEDYMEEDDGEDEEMPDIPLSRSADVHDVRLGDSTEIEAETGRAGPSNTSANRSLSEPESRSYGYSLGGTTRSREVETGGRRRFSSSSASEPRLKFFGTRGKELQSSLTILQAVQQLSQNVDDDVQDYGRYGRRRLWDEIHTIHYGRMKDQKSNSSDFKTLTQGASSTCTDQSPNIPSSLSPGALLDTDVPDLLKDNEELENVLFLLRLIYGLNKSAPELMHGENYEKFSSALTTSTAVVPSEDFLNSKVASKIMRQLQDPITLFGGSMPQWCKQMVIYAFFLLPFEIRRHFLYCTAFGVPRALLRIQQFQTSTYGSGNDSESRDLRVGRLMRQKVRVQRTRILESAIKVMDMYASSKAVLEVEYFNEVGSGLGPTMEFYTLLSHELQRKSLEMWRDFETAGSDDATGDVKDIRTSSTLLFPKPLSSDHPKRSKILNYFKMIGTAVGKAILDSRLMDLPLSPAFLRLVRGNTLGDSDMVEVDPQIARTLHKFQSVAKKYAELLDKGKRGDDAIVLVDGVEVHKLGLDFTYPGMPEYKLRPRGDSIDVTLSTLSEYINTVKDATLHSGVQAQAEAFREGFNSVISMDVLRPFSECEIDLLLCGTHESWNVEMLAESIKFDHGYTSSSPPIRQFLKILSELDFECQRAFLRFVTGCPRLPPSGLAGLTPKLTVVRKQPSGLQTSSPGKPANPATNPGTTAADADLPSVMTCANYLKLPPYSSEEIMKERIMFAIKEGQCSFDLS